MGDAVIVAAARTAIGTARKGSLVDVSAFDLAPARPGGSPDAARASRVARSMTSSWASRSRAAATSPATSRSSSAWPTFPARDQPALRVGPHRGPDRGGEHPRRHGQGGHRGRHREPLDHAQRDEAHARAGSEPQPWMSPSHPQTRGAPAFDMSLTVGWNTAREANVTREQMDEWAYHSHRRAAAARATVVSATRSFRSIPDGKAWHARLRSGRASARAIRPSSGSRRS